MKTLNGAGMLLLSAAMTPAFAQDGAPTPPTSQPDALGEIIVTAQRRSESLQKTPVAVSVLTSDALIKKNISSEADLRVTVPGLIVRAGQNSNALNYAIRGESLDPFSNTRPGVLPYVNEVQVSTLGGSTAFYDLQSIQVLKGPQGTLFGRNSTGGAVLFTTVKPTSQPGGYVSAELGNYSLRKFEGALNVPIVDDRVMLRVAGISHYHQGYQINELTGEHLGTVKRNGGRISLTVKPVEGLENTTVFDYLKSGGSPMTAVLYSLTPSGPIPVIALSEGALPQYANITDFLEHQKQVGLYRPSVDGSTSFRSKNTLVSNVTTYDVAKDTQIRNIFGFVHVNQSLFSDSDGSPYQVDDNDPLGKLDKSTMYSEEIQLTGKTLGRNLTYTTGFYYAHETINDFTTSRLLGISGPGFLQFNTAKTGSTTYAVYAQGTYDLGELTGVRGLGITAGTRYSSERTSIDILPEDISHSDPAAQQATYQFDQHHTYRNASWTFGVQEQLNPNTLLYAASRHSYRNGGFNGFVKPVPGLGNVGGNRYAAESVTDAEIGAKFQGRVGDMPIRSTIALYTLWIKQAQRAANILVGGAPAAITVNVPRSRVRGIEYDGQISPVEWFSIGGSLTYTDAKNTRNLVPIAGGAPVAFDTYPDAPKWSGAVFVELTAPLRDSLHLTLHGDMYAQSHSWFVGTGGVIPGARLPGYTLVNVRLGLENDKSGWSLSANLKNAFNKLYWVGGEATGQLFQLNTANPGEPRTIAIDARLKF